MRNFMKMPLKNKKTLFLYTGKHPVHLAFAKSINADIEKLSSKIRSGYKFYLIEGAYVLPSMLKKMSKISKSSKIIVLFADPRLYYLHKKIVFNKKKKKIQKMSLFRALLSKYALRKLSGAICEGKVNYDLFKQMCPKIPVEEVSPFVWDKTFKKMLKIKPNLNSKKILFVGNGPDRYCKGLNILLSIFKEIRKEDKSLELHIFGSHWGKKHEKEKIFFHGKKDISEYLQKFSLLVHLGQGEGFGINILESLLAGIPTIISDKTGAKNVVKNIDPTMVVPLNKLKIKKAIENYFSYSLSKKKKISRKGRDVAKNFTEKKQLNNFKIQYNNLTKKILENGKKRY